MILLYGLEGGLALTLAATTTYNYGVKTCLASAVAKRHPKTTCWNHIYCEALQFKTVFEPKSHFGELVFGTFAGEWKEAKREE